MQAAALTWRIISKDTLLPKEASFVSTLMGVLLCRRFRLQSDRRDMKLVLHGPLFIVIFTLTSIEGQKGRRMEGHVDVRFW